ncbi:hypothetical protein MAIT1_00011 [Magnetofaba australis IT-1]|uniref:Uncharacterized protein n=1 Tax=Magnetofaba australis IT-1 TaxID=1434232 RepID=A0A1Y2K8M3_9PROT|nr:hypothetical protein MAIT1_00011 [Magnetofaba australis IT-1]
MEQALIQRLPGYEHVAEIANLKRMVRTMQSGQRACAVSMFKRPERARTLLFSKPYLAVLPGRLVIRARDRDRFAPWSDDQGRVRLQALLDQAPMTLGFAQGRAYGGGIDAVIGAHATPRNSLPSYSNEVFQDLLVMLDNRRIDYTVAFSFELTHAQKQMSLSQRFITLPIAESPPYTLNYVACVKSPWGEAVMAKINPILMTLRATPTLYGPYKGTLDEQAASTYDALVQSIFAPASPAGTNTEQPATSGE